MLRIYVKSPPAPVSNIYPVKYGLLYNWYAATDVRNICASGWHVPTMEEGMTMSSYLGENSIAGGKLKEIGLTYWTTPNTGATNEAFFNARGSSGRGNTSFLIPKSYAWYWTSSQKTETYGSDMSLSYNNTIFSVGSAQYNVKYNGESIRIVKDSTTLTHGQSGTYTGNDGKVYRTICIGTQEWLSDNLAETQFRNGDWIPGFDGGVYTPIDDATWAAATTAMCCVYDDDLTNM